jgi:hypothetical protein
MGGDLKSKQEKVGQGYNPNPNTADRKVPDIAHLLPFNEKNDIPEFKYDPSAVNTHF